MSFDQETNIDQLYNIVQDKRKLVQETLDDLERALTGVKDILEEFELQLSQEHRVKLIEITIFILDRAKLRTRLVGDVLNICRKLTSLYSISVPDQTRLINKIHFVFGTISKDQKLQRNVMNLRKMAQIIKNIVLNEGSNFNILSNQTSSRTIYKICEWGFKIDPSTISPELVKAVLLNWPERFQPVSQHHGQKKATTSIVNEKNNDWSTERLEEFVKLCVDYGRGMKPDQQEAKKSLEFAVIRALSIDFTAVHRVLERITFGIIPAPHNILRDYIDTWFREIGSNQQLAMDDTIISCHLLLTMLGSHQRTRPREFVDYACQICPKAILLFERLAVRYRSLFNPSRRGPTRLTDPCEGMISQMLYNFVMVQSDDPEWQDKVLSFITPDQASRLVKILVSACSKSMILLGDKETEGRRDFVPPGEDDEIFWGEFHDQAYRIISDRQRASFGIHLRRPDNTFERL